MGQNHYIEKDQKQIFHNCRPDKTSLMELNLSLIPMIFTNRLPQPILMLGQRGQSRWRESEEARKITQHEFQAGKFVKLLFEVVVLPFPLERGTALFCQWNVFSQLNWSPVGITWQLTSEKKWESHTAHRVEREKKHERTIDWFSLFCSNCGHLFCRAQRPNVEVDTMSLFFIS